MFKKSINIFTLSTSLLIFWNNSALSNIPNNSPEFTDNKVFFAKNQIDLTGNWIGKGYSCEKSGLIEQIQINVIGNELVAKKITGDNCVPAGNITFQGTLPDLISGKKSFPVTFTVGNPSNPASGKATAQLRIIDANSLYAVSSTGEKITFKRASQSDSAYTRIDLTGTWVENASVVTIDQRGCTGGDSGGLSVGGQDPQHRVFSLRQSGNQLIFPTETTTWGSGSNRGSGTQFYQGTVSSNQVTYIISGNAGGGFTAQFTGNISEDGNTVSGKGICRGSRGSATANVTFSWKRQPNSQSERPTNLQSNVSLAGKWQSDWGPVVFNPDLTGYWNQGSGVGQIKDGIYDPKTRQLIFHYYQPWNDMNGTATFTLSEDGNRLSGSWSQQRGSNPPGSGGTGGWTMTRVNIPTTGQVEREIEKRKPKVCLPVVGCL